MRKTNIYDKNGNFTRSEKMCTLSEYIEMARLKVGQYILIGDVKEEQGQVITLNCSSFFVGDCTVFHCPSKTDAGIGWSGFNLTQFVLEVHQH